MTRKILLFAAGLVLGTLIGLFFSYFQLSAPDLVVREPAVPGESRIEYVPPPPPRIPASMIKDGIPMLLSMLNKKVEQVTQDIYLASGYALGNVGIVVTKEGLVIIDTTESVEAAGEILAELRKITKVPVHTIIYTHYHPDHTQGTAAFYQDGVRVIATRDFVEYIHYQNAMLGPHHLRARATQAGAAAPGFAFDLPVDRNPFRAISQKVEVIMPTVTFDDEYAFDLGGKRFELFHTSGETPDHLAVWLPEQKTLFVGDLYYRAFPNLSTPMLESRPVRGWIRSLSRFIEMQPEFLIPGHTGALSGAKNIEEHLRNYRAAIQYVHDETVRCINAGMTVDEAAAEIRLPPDLAALDYLDETYGRVAWSVRGIYHGYQGWYDGYGTNLNPLPPFYSARELVNLAGGADLVLKRAIELQRKGEHQLVTQLCDAVLAANPADRMAHRIKAASLRVLAYSFKNLNSFGSYRSAHALHMQAFSAGE
jgi:alkyl sulfatase BDS1-like metallo-beta-lactamase superfamily hydrolase